MIPNLNNQETTYIHKVYRNITLLGILLHTTYAILFGVLRFSVPFLYNLADILFYAILMLLVIRYERYSLTVSLIHLETMLFCFVHVCLFGWEPAFYIYLIAMASLVYFCPYRSIYIPYVFSFLHMIVFFTLYGYSITHSVILLPDAFLTKIFFICNNIAAFIIILYVAYVSKASASVGRQELLNENKDLQHMANYDQMTGLYNRTCLRTRYEHTQKERNVLAIGDIDDFKAVNDTYGHICGDVILKELAELMRANLDPNIMLCRWGGEEFVLMFNGVSLQEAKQQLLGFCSTIEQHDFVYESLTIHITMTFGLSVRKKEQALDKWIEDADKLLYKGKHSGKNTVIAE